MRFFIECPAYIATGGTELLHQFSKCLTDRGIENYMIYEGVDPETSVSPTPDSFQKYQVQYVDKYIDTPDSVYVLAETRIHHIGQCVRGIAMIWWLSVDNYVLSYKASMANGPDVFQLRNRKNIIHFVQSQYAEDFLRKSMHISEVYYLMDYINDDIVLTGRILREKYERQAICLYNPRKGFENIKPIIRACRPDIKWIPLQGLSPQEMALLMCKAKVYIDFGGHPGKDRIPREAAVCGCCVITNQVGSAAYEDVPIPEQYKVKDMSDIYGVLCKIYDLVEYYDERKLLFEKYIEIIEDDKQRFEKDTDYAIELLMKKMNPISEKRQDSDKYIAMQESMHEAVKEIWNRLSIVNEKNDASEAIGELLKAESILHLLGEAIHTEIDSMLNDI